MTNEKLNEVLLLINDLYPNRAPAITERVVAVWLECFKEYDDAIVDKAVMQAIKECKYPPTINDLVGYCDHFKGIHDEIVSDIRLIYREITDLCRREERNEETWNVFKECIKDEDISKSQQKALDLQKRFWRLYHKRDCDFSNNKSVLPPLAEWFKEQKSSINIPWE